MLQVCNEAFDSQKRKKETKCNEASIFTFPLLPM